jgi:hypothetical protein
MLKRATRLERIVYIVEDWPSGCPIAPKARDATCPEAFCWFSPVARSGCSTSSFAAHNHSKQPPGVGRG